MDWKEGRITRKRSKTSSHEGVPVVSYKLWPETLHLLRSPKNAERLHRAIAQLDAGHGVERDLVEP